MKRSRNDQILTVVNHYLKRRQYMDSTNDELKRGRCPIRNVQEHIAAGTVLNNGSTQATVAYSSSCSDAETWGLQFDRFRNFVQNALEPYQSELSQLLFPLFVHIYLELICVGHKFQAHRFEEHYRFLFDDVEEAQLIISTLKTVNNPDEVKSNEQTGEFREHKYKVLLTEGAFLYLSGFLKNEENVVILQMINQGLDITVKECDSKAVCSLVVDDSGDQSATTQTSPTGLDSKSTTNVNLNALQRIIQKIDDGPPPLPSICQYSLLNTYQGLSTVSISHDEKSLCAGFEDSRLIVWSLVPEPLPCSAFDPTRHNVSHVSVAGDCLEDIEQRLQASRSLDISSPECATLRAHSGPVYCSCFLHDDNFLLSASEDKTVRLWDVSKRSNIVCYRGHNYPVYCVDVSPVTSLFATSSFDETAKLWSTDRVFPIRTFIGHTRSVNCVRFHANGNYLATGSSDSTVRLWSLQDAQPVRLMHGHRGMVMSLAFSANGKYLASAGEDRRVKIWDLSTGTLLRDLRGHTDFIHSLAFSNDNQILASGGLDGVLRLWQVDKQVEDTGNQSVETGSSSSSLLGSFPTKSASIVSLRFSKHNFLIAAGS